jgi:RNA polymerase sigma-70 factor (ECF subfamily)
MHDHEQCRAFFEKLSEYIDEELDQHSCDVIEAHLRQCPPCQTCLATLKQTVALCRKLKTASVPEEFSQRLRAMIQHHHMR